MKLVLIVILLLISLPLFGNGVDFQVGISVGKSPSHCKGVLMRPNLVITARHCIFQHSSERIRILWDGEQRRVSQIESMSATFSFPAHDISMLVLEDPISIKKYPRIGRSIPKFGTLIDGVRVPNMIQLPTLPTSLCNSDSGSGLYVEKQGELELYAIVIGRMTGMTRDLHDCREGGFLALRLWPYLDWIEKGLAPRFETPVSEASSFEQACKRKFDDSSGWGITQNILSQLVSGLSLGKQESFGLYTRCERAKEYLTRAGAIGLPLTLYGAEVGDNDLSWLREYPHIDIRGWRKENVRFLSNLENLKSLAVLGMTDRFETKVLKRHKGLENLTLKHGAMKGMDYLRSLEKLGTKVTTYDLDL